MKSLIKKLILTAILFAMMILLLCNSKIAKEFAYLGLITWFEQMIPSLVPFMIVSGLIVRMDLTSFLVKPLAPVFRPVFAINNHGIYVIVMGFLCGFPMGAKSAIDLYRRGKLSKEETEYLLAFTNNIGPAYFLSYVLGFIYITRNLYISLFLMFGIPLLYGIFLRHTIYRKKISYNQKSSPKLFMPRHNTLYQFFDALDESVNGALVQIAGLGGYMILFNLLVLVPFLLCKDNKTLYAILHSVMEISGGLAILQKLSLTYQSKLLLVHGLLSFNGLCCFAQTLHILKGTDISAKKYMLHKIILCSITLLTTFLLI